MQVGKNAESEAALVAQVSDALTLQSGHSDNCECVVTVTRPPEESVQLTTRHRAAAKIQVGPLVYFRFGEKKRSNNKKNKIK